MLRLVDEADPRFHLFATLGSGLLRFEVVARLESGERGSVSGRDFFSSMLAWFGPRIRIVESVWDRESGLVDNLDAFQRACETGSTGEQAAAKTWTGSRLAEAGFERVQLMEIEPDEPPYGFVRVRFSR